MEAVIGKILGDLGTFLFGPIMLTVFFGVTLVPQALWFIVKSAFVICTITALIIMVSGVWNSGVTDGTVLAASASGALISVQLLWDAADVCNGLMAIPNLFSLILFGGIVVKDTKDFFAAYDKERIEKT